MSGWVFPQKTWCCRFPLHPTDQWLLLLVYVLLRHCVGHGGCPGVGSADGCWWCWLPRLHHCLLPHLLDGQRVPRHCRCVCVCVAGGDEGRASGEALQSPSGLLGPYWHDMSVLVTFFTLRQAFNPFHERHCCLTQLRCCVVCNCLAHTGFIGALGSFVSGSVLGSNMTQGAIQAVAAERLGVSVTSMLAVQVAGACAGKMVCIGSILVSSLTHVGVGSASN